MTDIEEGHNDNFSDAPGEIPVGIPQGNESEKGLNQTAVKALIDIRNYAHTKHLVHRGIRNNLMQLITGKENQKEVEGFIKFQKKIEDGTSSAKLEGDISSVWYAADRSIARSSSPASVWDTIKRRAAWKHHPLRMMGLTFTQIALCIIVAISSSEPINSGTAIMAGLYILATGASNPMKISRDAIGILERCLGYKKSSKIVDKNVSKSSKPKEANRFVIGFVLLLFFPISVVVFMVTVTLDLISGEIFDLSYGNMCNIIVRTFVVFTAISVGLRSGNPINAIQTYAGFDFIDSMDELVINALDIDYEQLAEDTVEKANNTKILFVRIMIYVSVPLIIAGFLYVTITNECFAFCNA